MNAIRNTATITAFFGTLYVIMHWAITLPWHRGPLSHRLFELAMTLGALLVAGAVAHCLLSLLRGTNVVDDFIDHELEPIAVID